MHLNLSTADVFMPASIAGASDQLQESMFTVVKMSANLGHAKLQQQIVEEARRQQQERAARPSKSQSMGSNGRSMGKETEGRVWETLLRRQERIQR